MELYRILEAYDDNKWRYRGEICIPNSDDDVFLDQVIRLSTLRKVFHLLYNGCFDHKYCLSSLTVFCKAYPDIPAFKLVKC